MIPFSIKCSSTISITMCPAVICNSWILAVISVWALKVCSHISWAGPPFNPKNPTVTKPNSFAFFKALKTTFVAPPPPGLFGSPDILNCKC